MRIFMNPEGCAPTIRSLIGSYLLGLIYNPNIAIANVLSMLLKLEAAGSGGNLDPAIGFFDLGVIMDLDAIPPNGGPGIGYLLVTFPLGIFENKVEGMPLAIRSPGIAVGHTVHAKGRDPMRTDLPVVGILDVFSLG